MPAQPVPGRLDAEGHPGLPWLPPALVVPLPGRGEMFARVMDGPDDRPPVLLVHGWMVTADLNWFPLLAALRGRRKVITFDLRDHGRGPLPSRGFSLEDCADDAAALLDHLGLGPAVVVGYSLGGAVAQLFHARHPGRTAGSVLAATAVRWTRLRDRLTAERNGWAGTVQRVTGGRWGARLLVDRAVQRTPELAPLRRWLMAEMERGHPGGLRQAGRAVARFDGRRLSVAEVPTVVVVTCRDRLLPPERQRELAQVRAAPVIELDADHDAPLALMHDFVRAMVDAVERVSAPATPPQPGQGRGGSPRS